MLPVKFALFGQADIDQPETRIAYAAMFVNRSGWNEL